MTSTAAYYNRVYYDYMFISYEECPPVVTLVVGLSSSDGQFLLHEPFLLLVFSQLLSSQPFDTGLVDHSPKVEVLYLDTSTKIFKRLKI